MTDEASSRVVVGPAASTSFTKSGDRQRFTLELRPGETTIVSWKKLIKEANNASRSASAMEPLSSPVIPPEGQPAETELKDEPQANRFNAVIEKIERLYKGNDSSDGDLDDVPNDDQYDTEDSFIDDDELDDYFKVDNCSTKHNGFFVNKGKLEAFRKESPLLPAQQPKKRRRKDIPNALGDDGPFRKKQAKVDKLTIEAKSPTSGHNNSRASNGAAPAGWTETKVVVEETNNEQQSKFPTSRVKDIHGQPDPPRQTNYSHIHSDSHSERKLNNENGLLRPMKHKTKSAVSEMKGTHISDGKHVHATNTRQLHKKDVSNVKTKAIMLEKAIKELERMVSESRPPTMEVQDADMSGQAVKRRLPRELKQKLAKVARLAQANYGEVSEEVVNRLMGFLGHTMQLRTLKRNLRTMISSSLSANQEKEVRFQQIKREVIELISEEFEEQARIQEFDSEGKRASITKYTMSIVLEDKLCDLYDLYADGLEEDSGSQIRKLYAELAQLWPNAAMDNHGIKRAICRSKDRKRALHQQEKESGRISEKNLSTPKLVDKGKLGTIPIALRQEPQPLERQTTDLIHQGSNYSNHLVPISTLALEAPKANASTLDRLKKEKAKFSPNSDFVDGARPLLKNMSKRQRELESSKVHVRPEKLPIHGDDRQKAQLPVHKDQTRTHQPLYGSGQ
ncbi:unnamed protein product [Rhodiola kirilowii]